MSNFKFLKYGAMALTVMGAVAQPGFAANPIVQTIYTADPAPMVHNGTLYVYTGHDEDNANWFVMKDWHCYSTTDMANWTDHGSPLSLKTFDWVKDSAWAGQCIERDGKFYWYVPVEQKSGGMVIGVAVADSPAGPFKDPIGKPLVSDGWGDIDPTVFIDDDGQAYLYWGNPDLKYAKLNKDMTSIDTSIGNKGVVRVPLTVEAFGKRKSDDRATSYEEAPWIYKRNGLYYMVFAGGPVPEHIAYSTGPSATGPWTYRGVIMPTQGGSFTNHPGIVDYKGHSYFVYHNGALPGGGGFTRSVAVEEFKYNSDGTIPTINMTKEGPVALKNLDPYVRTETETIAWESGIETEPSSQGGMVVHDIDNGDYIQVKNVDFGASGAGTFMASVASGTKAKASKGGVLELRLDSVDGPLVGTLNVSYTGGSDKWKTETTAVKGANGVHDLFLVFKGEPTGDLFKFDYWQFAKKATAAQLVAINATIDKYKIDSAPTGNKATLSVSAIYADGTSRDVTAQAKVVAQKAGIVKVEKNIVTGAAFGETELQVSFGGKTDTLPVIVKDLKTEFTVAKVVASVQNVQLINGGTLPFTATAEYVDGHTEDITNTATYTVAAPEMVAVKNGVITGSGAGSTSVTLSFKGEAGAAISTKINATVKNRDPFAQNEAEDFNEQSGIVIENSTETAKNICDAQNGEWVKFNAIDFGDGANSLDVRVASATDGGNLEVRLDRLDGPLVATLKVENTGGWQNWVTKSGEVKDAKGKHDVYFKFTGGPGVLFNMNWWKFNK